jgi:hypothetical protein
MEHLHMAKIAAGQKTLTAGHTALLDKPGRDFWSETLTAVLEPDNTGQAKTLSTIMHGRSHRLMTSTMVKYIQE